MKTLTITKELDGSIDLETISNAIYDNMTSELWKEIEEYCNDNPLDLFWDYRDGLSEEQVDKLLNGEVWEVYDDIYEWNTDYIWELEETFVRDNIMPDFWHYFMGLPNVPYIDIDDLHDGQISELASQLELRQFVIVDINLKYMASNTFVNITLDLPVVDDDYAHSPINYGMYYDDLEPTLDFFKVNPRSMLKYFNVDDPEAWPNIPDRNINKLVSPKQLAESWINMFYNGNYVAMLGGYLDLLDIAEVIRQKSETPDKRLMATLAKGTRIICHDFMNGSSGTDFVLLKDLKVEVTGQNSLHRDGKHKYGVQDVCGYVGDVWDSPLVLELE